MRRHFVIKRGNYLERITHRCGYGWDDAVPLHLVPFTFGMLWWAWERP